MKNVVIYFRDKTVVEVQELTKITVVDSFGTKEITQFDGFVFYSNTKYVFSGAETISLNGDDILYLQFY